MAKVNDVNLKDVHIGDRKINFVYEDETLFTLKGKSTDSVTLPEVRSILKMDGIKYIVTEINREYTEPKYETFTGSTTISVTINIVLNLSNE